MRGVTTLEDQQQIECPCCETAMYRESVIVFDGEKNTCEVAYVCWCGTKLSGEGLTAAAALEVIKLLPGKDALA